MTAASPASEGAFTAYRLPASGAPAGAPERCGPSPHEAGSAERATAPTQPPVALPVAASASKAAPASSHAPQLRSTQQGAAPDAAAPDAGATQCGTEAGAAKGLPSDAELGARLSDAQRWLGPERGECVAALRAVVQRAPPSAERVQAVRLSHASLLRSAERNGWTRPADVTATASPSAAQAGAAPARLSPPSASAASPPRVTRVGHILDALDADGLPKGLRVPPESESLAAWDAVPVPDAIAQLLPCEEAVATPGRKRKAEGPSAGSSVRG